MRKLKNMLYSLGNILRKMHLKIAYFAAILLFYLEYPLKSWIFHPIFIGFSSEMAPPPSPPSPLLRGQYLVTSLSLSILGLQKSYFHENSSEFNQKFIGSLRPSLVCLVSKLRAISTNQRLAFCLIWGGGGVKGQN